MHVSERTLGELDCQVVDTVPDGATPGVVMVICHGFGAPGTDLVPVASDLLRVAPGLVGRVRFVFPAAPLSLDEVGMPGGRAWWHLDLQRLTAAIEQGDFRDQRATIPEGLPQARQLLNGLVEQIMQEWDLTADRLVLGGFSQGSMLATDVALRLAEPPAALVAWSSTLLCEDQWRELAAARGRLRVLQSHGRSDSILPFAAAEWLRELFDEAGFAVEFLEFPGDHTIPAEAIHRTASLLEEVAEA